jgi:hypothetical protein
MALVVFLVFSAVTEHVAFQVFGPKISSGSVWCPAVGCQFGCQLLTPPLGEPDSVFLIHHVADAPNHPRDKLNAQSATLAACPELDACVSAPRRSQPLSMAIANKISATAMSTNSDKVCIYLPPSP